MANSNLGKTETHCINSNKRLKQNLKVKSAHRSINTKGPKCQDSFSGIKQKIL